MQLTICPRENSSCTSSSAEKQIHEIQDPRIANVLKRSLCCPLTNIDCWIPKGIKLKTGPLFKRSLSDRQTFTFKIAKQLKSTSKKLFLGNAVAESSSLISNWKLVETIIPIESLQKYFCRWILKTIFGFVNNLDAIAENMHDITASLPPLPLSMKIITIKEQLRDNLTRTHTLNSLFSSEMEVDEQVAICFDLLFVMQQSGTLYLNYMLWVLARDSSLQAELRTNSEAAEKIYAETGSWDQYKLALVPLGDFLRQWKTDYFPKKWTSTIQFPMLLKSGHEELYFNKGDKVSYEAESTLENQEETLSWFIAEKEHHCLDEKSFHLVLQLVLSKILTTFHLGNSQPHLTFSIQVFPVPHEPIALILTPVKFDDDD